MREALLRQLTCLLALIAVLSVSLFSASAVADRVYIRDKIYVPMRSGESADHRILQPGLPTGTELERLSTNRDTGYTHVRTSDGQEGYIQSQYLVDEPIAQRRLADLNQQYLELEKTHQQTLLRLQDMEAENRALAKTNEQLATETDNIKDELNYISQLAANVIAIDDENQALTEEVQTLRSQINTLSEINTLLSDETAQQWFIRGAGIILLGLLFGFWVARRIYHRKSSSWS